MSIPKINSGSAAKKPALSAMETAFCILKADPALVPVAFEYKVGDSVVIGGLSPHLRQFNNQAFQVCSVSK
ncbi:MAG: hypothetical protein ACXV7F_10005 [Methylomonas sp.]